NVVTHFQNPFFPVPSTTSRIHYPELDSFQGLNTTSVILTVVYRKTSEVRENTPPSPNTDLG
ncbi:hypothetical protein SK128_007027, partial [Halocaridina rubra]